MQQIALGEARVALGAFAVELHALEADVFLRQRGGQQGNGLGEEAVEPLARVVLCDLEFFHGGHPALSELIFGYFTTREQEL